MKIRNVICILSVFFSTYACNTKAPKISSGKSVVDWFGKSVKIPERVNRVVPLFYVQAEILCAIGAKEKIVGIGKVTSQSSVFLNENFPQILNLPQVGQTNIDYEKIVALKPDIVFTGTEKPVKDRLDDLGLVSVSTYPKNLDEILKEVVLYGVVMGNEKEAHKIYLFYKSLLDSITQLSKNLSYKKRVYYIRTDALTSLGGNVLGEVFNASGAELVTRDIGDNSTSLQLSFEDIQKLNPEVIIIRDRASVTPEDIYKDFRWKNITAVKNKMIFQEHKGWTEFRLETIFGILEKAKWLNPKVFESFDCESEYKRFLNIVKENNE